MSPQTLKLSQRTDADGCVHVALLCEVPDHPPHAEVLMLPDGFHILNSDQDLVAFGVSLGVAVEWVIHTDDLGKRAVNKLADFYAGLLEQWDQGGFFDEERVLN